MPMGKWIPAPLSNSEKHVPVSKPKLRMSHKPHWMLTEKVNKHVIQFKKNGFFNIYIVYLHIAINIFIEQKHRIKIFCHLI